MKPFLVFLFLAQNVLMAQTVHLTGCPENLNKEKIIILKHEPIKITANPNDSKAQKYVFERQMTHNRVIKEANRELTVAAMKYPFNYGLATQSTYLNLAKAGYKFVLISQVYKNEYLNTHPGDQELIVFEYFIYDLEYDIAYKVFELDENKVYDSKLLIRKLNKELKKIYN